MSAATDAFVKQNQQRLLEELKQFLRIPSISTLPENRADVERAAELRGRSLAHRRAWRMWSSSRPTNTRWSTPIGCTRPASPRCCATATTMCSRPTRWNCGRPRPSSRSERDGNLYGRGTADDKGQMYSHIKAIEALKATTGTLPVNITLPGGRRRGGRRRFDREVCRREPRKARAPMSPWCPIPRCTPKACRRSASGCADWSTWRWRPRARNAICTPASTAAPRPTRSSA